MPVVFSFCHPQKSFQMRFEEKKKPQISQITQILF